jgi:hypothetical protein
MGHGICSKEELREILVIQFVPFGVEDKGVDGIMG